MAGCHLESALGAKRQEEKKGTSCIERKIDGDVAKMIPTFEVKCEYYEKCCSRLVCGRDGVMRAFDLACHSCKRNKGDKYYFVQDPEATERFTEEQERRCKKYKFNRERTIELRRELRG